MKINFELIFTMCVLLFVGFGIFYVGNKMIEVGEDNTIMKCISNGDVVNNKWNRDLCISLMEKADWNKRDDARGRLYDALGGLDE